VLGPVECSFLRKHGLADTWSSVNQNALRRMMKCSAVKNVGVVLEFLLCYSAGLLLIHKPRQLGVNFIDMNGRTLVPRNNFDFAVGFIN